VTLKIRYPKKERMRASIFWISKFRPIARGFWLGGFVWNFVRFEFSNVQQARGFNFRFVLIIEIFVKICDFFLLKFFFWNYCENLWFFSFEMFFLKLLWKFLIFFFWNFSSDIIVKFCIFFPLNFFFWCKKLFFFFLNFVKISKNSNEDTIDQDSYVIIIAYLFIIANGLQGRVFRFFASNCHNWTFLKFLK